MHSIFMKLLYQMEKYLDTVLVTIIYEQGSSPRGVGAQMLVDKSGRVIGTIGGGAVEYSAEKMALKLLEEKRSTIHEFSLHDRNDQKNIGMICGGNINVLFQYISCTDHIWSSVAGELVNCIHMNKKGWLLQQINGGTPSLLDENGFVLAGESTSGVGDITISGASWKGNYFLMPIPVGERAVIFGGGHIALALVPLLRSVGFRVTVMDCREDFATKERFPQAEQVVCGNYLELSNHLTLSKEDYVVIMTNGHSYDFEIQEQVLRNPLAYIGVIGSRSKTAAVNQKLREKGIPEETIHRVHTPIGTNIKAVTPEEIAVSIAGEMIYVRALRREEAGKIHHSCPMH